jgi:miniconductance mechanosensitive channel
MVWSLNGYYEIKFNFAKQYPIYSYLKVIVLFIWIIGIMLIISFFLNTSPWALLTGIGAVSAVLLLVFKDTLLGIISSIQATALNIVRIGDRICMDKYGIDGTVVDISINTVRVRNSDNTVANIPTYMLTTEVIKNWRSMEEAGARRIKRSIHLDIDSIVVCTPELLNQLGQMPVLKEYLKNNQNIELSNLTLFRVYLKDYLDRHELINHNYLTIVYHLDPTANGLPVEIYTFSKLTSFEDYELVQSNIFEHLFSVLPRFELAIFRVR